MLQPAVEETGDELLYFNIFLKILLKAGSCKKSQLLSLPYTTPPKLFSGERQLGNSVGEAYGCGSGYLGLNLS